MGTTLIRNIGTLVTGILDAPLRDADSILVLAVVAKRCWDNLRPSGVKVHGGTLLLVPGLEEKDFDTIAAAGIGLVKFIFYDYGLLPNGEVSYLIRTKAGRAESIRCSLRDSFSKHA